VRTPLLFATPNVENTAGKLARRGGAQSMKTLKTK
jgi:hypothetical protein